MSSNDYYTAISDIGITSRPDEVPQGYILVSRSVSGIDAQLWPGKRSDKAKRYLCVKPLQKSDKVVVEDIVILKETKATPRGYTYRDTTLNDGIAALRKQKICVKYISSSNAQSALCSIILVNRAKSEYAPPKHEYTENDINGFHICFDKVNMSRCFQQSQPPQPVLQQQPGQHQQVQHQQVQYQPVQHQPMQNQPLVIEQPLQSLTIASSATQPPQSHNPIQRTDSRDLQHSASGDLDGVPLLVSPSFDIRKIGDIPDNIYQSPYLIDEKYQHDFALENDVVARIK
ncbi:Multivesicular body subunit 12B [Trichoplax sp. H2]|nr:Multivesicular body subunit 12B [Trichoplax sp. H2]|eukprot:RDD39903.1 Multivesicular body subunit 12B [Trichoplax sp. H2]